MRMTIRYQSGLRVEAVLLAANRERMRVAIASQRDTIELHKVDACWYTEQGAEIEIEALIPIAGLAPHASAPLCTLGQMRRVTDLRLPNYQAVPSVCGSPGAVSVGRQR